MSNAPMHASPIQADSQPAPENPGGTWRDERTSRPLALFFSEIVRGFRSHRVLYAALVVYAAAYVLMRELVGLPFFYDTAVYFITYGALYLFLLLSVILLVKTVRIMYSGRPDQPIRQLLDWAGAQILVDHRLANGIHGVIVVSGSLLIFSSFKSSIPYINDFRWDTAFMSADRVIFGGVDPWLWLDRVIGRPWVTAIVNTFYNMWIIVVVAALFFACFARDSEARLQFLVSVVLAWIAAGTLLAILFSSAGPCFYGRLLPGPDPYFQQMEYLRYANDATGAVSALNIQDILWAAYSEGEGKVSGISAMPSLHVIFAILIAAYAFRINRVAGVALSLFAAIIFVGSVHLAWHYAVDSLAAVPIAFGLWTLSGLVARRVVEERDVRANR